MGQVRAKVRQEFFEWIRVLGVLEFPLGQQLLRYVQCTRSRVYTRYRTTVHDIGCTPSLLEIYYSQFTLHTTEVKFAMHIYV